MAGDLSVRDADGDPGGPLAPRAGAHHLQDPGLLRVGDGERFALVAVAVVGHQAGHHPDGLPGGAGPLQGPGHQRCAIDQSLGIVKFIPAAEGRLADGKLMFVHPAHDLVRMCDLRDLAGRPLVFRPAGLDGDRFARLVVRGGNHRQRGVQSGQVATVGDHHRAVGRGPAGDDDARAGAGGRRRPWPELPQRTAAATVDGGDGFESDRGASCFFLDGRSVGS